MKFKKLKKITCLLFAASMLMVSTFSNVNADTRDTSVPSTLNNAWRRDNDGATSWGETVTDRRKKCDNSYIYLGGYFVKGNYCHKKDGGYSGGSYYSSTLATNLYADTIAYTSNGVKNCGYRYNNDERKRRVYLDGYIHEYLFTNYVYERYGWNDCAIKFYNGDYCKITSSAVWSPDSSAESGHSYSYL